MVYGTVYTVRAVAVSGEGGKGRRCQEDARAIGVRVVEDSDRGAEDSAPWGGGLRIQPLKSGWGPAGLN